MELLVANVVDGENPIENDLKLAGGVLVFSNDLATCTAQRLRVRFRFFKGEWFLDRNEGTPWYQSIFVKPFSLSVARAIFAFVVRTTPGVLAVDSLDLDFDRGTRQLSLDFVARLIDGSLLSSDDFGPFVVRV